MADLNDGAMVTTNEIGSVAVSLNLTWVNTR